MMFKLEVGAQMKDDAAGGQWLGEMQESSALIGSILGVTHPGLYKQGCAALTLLSDEGGKYVDNADELMRALKIWNSPFSALSVITNRNTPAHRDTKGRNEWFDIIVALGEDDSVGVMTFPGLGLSVGYNPGTVIAIAGKVIRHAANFEGGERACIAYYMRNKVHERLGIPAGTWMNCRVYDDQPLV
jgi:hypothetical protein